MDFLGEGGRRLELEVRPDVRDLDLDGLTLVAVVVLPVRWTSLPATMTHIPFLRLRPRSLRLIDMPCSDSAAWGV